MYTDGNLALYHRREGEQVPPSSARLALDLITSVAGLAGRQGGSAVRRHLLSARRDRRISGLRTRTARRAAISHDVRESKTPQTRNTADDEVTVLVRRTPRCVGYESLGRLDPN